MSAKVPVLWENEAEELASLVQVLHETQRRLFELTGGEVDAVVHPDGKSYMLHDAQEQLRQSDERFHGMYAASATGIAVSTPSGHYLQANPAYCRMLGYTEEELKELNFASITHPDDLPSNLRMQDDVLSGARASFVTQTRYLKKDSSVMWVRASVSATHSADGQLATLIVMAEDVTEAKESEKLLRWRTALFEAQLHSAQDGVLIVDNERNVIVHNQRLNDLLHIPARLVEDSDSLPLLEWVTGQVKDHQAFNDKVEWLYRHQEEVSLDEIELLSGTLLERFSAPVRGRDGIYYGRIWTFRDVTQRNLVERELQQQKTELQVLFDRIPALIWFKDTENKILRVNQRAADAAGIPIEEMEGRPMSAIYPRQAAGYYADDLEVIRSKSPKLGIIEKLESTEGREIWIQTDKVPFFGSDGEITGVVVMAQNITERKRSETRFRLLMDSNAQGVIFWSTTGEITGANDAFLNLVRYTRQDLEEGRISWKALTPPRYARRDALALEQMADKGVCTTYEKELIRSDGVLVPILLGAATFEDSPEEGVCFIVDLTERKEADNEIRYNEHRYRLIVEATTAIVWDTPASGEFTEEQPAWTSFTGQSFEELKGWGWLNAIHPDDRRETERCWAQAVADRVGYHTEHRLLARDKTYRTMSVSAVPLLGEDGLIRQWIGIHTDITDQKVAQQQILDQAALLDKTADAIMVWDLEGKVLFWNKGAERMYGWPGQDAVGRKTADFLYSDPAKFALLHAATIRETEWTGEIQHLTKGGEITIEARWTLICGNDGKPKSVLAINTDITEKKRIEQQFLRAQRMESIGTLAGGVAHDLNNILAPILMSIQILKLTTTDTQAEIILNTIEKSAKRGADIVRQVLSFARGLDGARIEVKPKHVLDEIENIIRDTFPKNIQLHFSVPNDSWSVLGDPTQVHQILLNLCVNARDAMPAGGDLTIVVSNCVLDDQYSAMNLHAKPGRYVQIAVTDSGTGIPRGVIDKMFEPFFTTKDMSKGTGLGLSTVMTIVKSHGGLINVYSEVGKGTTFKIYLPATQLSVTQDRPPEPEQMLPRGNGETILVIDDEASILTITAQTLVSFGYKVMTALDGAEALALYVENKGEVAIVLTDMTMPVMDGSATIRALKKLNPRVKIIAASGLNANGGSPKLSDLGVSEFLVKPYTAEALLGVLNKLLKTGADS